MYIKYYPICLWLMMPLMLLQSSCCTKKECDGRPQQFRLYGFTKAEIDTVFIQQYEKNSNFTQPKSTRKVFQDVQGYNIRESTDGTHLLVEGSFDWSYDFKVVLRKTNTTFSLTDMETGKEKCNSCLMGRDLYQVLSAYKVNGNRINKDFIELTR